MLRLAINQNVTLHNEQKVKWKLLTFFIRVHYVSCWICLQKLKTVDEETTPHSLLCIKINYSVNVSHYIVLKPVIFSCINIYDWWKFCYHISTNSKTNTMKITYRIGWIVIWLNIRMKLIVERSAKFQKELKIFQTLLSYIYWTDIMIILHSIPSSMTCILKLYMRKSKCVNFHVLQAFHSIWDDTYFQLYRETQWKRIVLTKTDNFINRLKNNLLYPWMCKTIMQLI